MWRHIASNGISFLVVALFLAAGAVVWGQGQYRAAGPLSSAICLQVEPGSSMRDVSQILIDENAVTSASIFRMGSDYTDKSSLLKAGSFLVPEAASMEQIVDIVTRGGRSTCGTEIVYRIGINRIIVQVRELDPETNRYVERAEFQPDVDGAPEIYTEMREANDTRYRVALAEGVTSWQVVNALNEFEVMGPDLEEIPAEGSLAPDSYPVTPGMDVSQVVAQMSAAQAGFLADAWSSRSDGLPLNSPEEALILASIVEKETGVAAEREQVASVFVNRLNRGMKLQTDPTVIYGITEGVGVLGRGLRQSELRAETPWNTYVIPALPPTPIANPGRASIEAALNPAETDFIFFVADGTGGHAFAITLDEHNANVARWREIEAERANQ